MSGETEADTTSDGPQTNAMETEDTSNAAASANVTTESPSKRTSKATPRKSRKRTSRAFEGDTETPTEGAGEANGGGGGGDRDDKREPKTPAPSAETPEKPKTKRSRRSTGKKVRDAAAAAAAASNPSADVLEPREAKDNQAGARRRDADGKAKAVSGRNGDGDNGSGADPMDEEKLAVVAPASEPAGVTPSATPAPDVEADAGGEGEKDVEEDGGGDTGEPKTVTIRVDNFVRPFTAAQAKKVKLFINSSSHPRCARLFILYGFVRVTFVMTLDHFWCFQLCFVGIGCGCAREAIRLELRPTNTTKCGGE